MAEPGAASVESTPAASPPAATPAASPPASSPPPSPAATPAAAPSSSAGGESGSALSTPSASSAPAAPKTSLDAAVLGLEASGLKLDQPLPEDQVVRIGGKPTGEPGAAASTPATAPAEPAPGTTPAAPAEPGAATEAEPAEGEADLPEPTEAELAAAPTPLKRRFRQVKEQNTRLKALVARVQPAAQQYEQLQSFLSTHELDARSAANALRVAALVQGALNGRVDPADALAEVAQVAGQLRVLVGDSLPADVQQRLNEGVIDDAAAKEIARLRAQRTTQARRAELDGAASTTQAVQATAGLLVSAVQTWEQAVRARDPDYPRKAKLVETTARALRLERYGNTLPPNVEAATAIAQEAYELVTKEFKAALPAPTEVRSPLNGAAPSRSTVRAAPTTSLEAAIQGLERMGT